MRDRFARVFLLAVCLVTITVSFSGCASTDPENESVRPWNTPKQWENGLPAGMMQGR